MNFEIWEDPLRFRLLGLSGTVENERYGDVGISLMNRLWPIVKAAGIPTTGINHWVYLPAGRMFVGVEVSRPDEALPPNLLEPLEFELRRYLRHLHVGPYQDLPAKWKNLMAEIAARGEVIGPHSLEIYGHHCVDPSVLETTILIGLESQAK